MISRASHRFSCSIIDTADPRWAALSVLAAYSASSTIQSRLEYFLKHWAERPLLSSHSDTA